MRLKILATGLLTGLALLIGAGSASAHAALIATDPVDGSEVAQGPERVQLTFNEAISPSFATLTVVGPDDRLWSKGDVTVEGSSISIAVGDLGPVGEYHIAYRVTSADGHAVQGINSFTLTQEGSGTPGASVKEAESDSGLSMWWFIGAAGVAFAVALGFALRRPKED